MASTDTAHNPTGRFAEQQLRFGSQYSATATQIEASFRESQPAGCKGINWQKLRKIFTDNNVNVVESKVVGVPTSYQGVQVVVEKRAVEDDHEGVEEAGEKRARIGPRKTEESSRLDSKQEELVEEEAAAETLAVLEKTREGELQTRREQATAKHKQATELGKLLDQLQAMEEQLKTQEQQLKALDIRENIMQAQHAEDGVQRINMKKLYEDLLAQGDLRLMESGDSNARLLAELKRLGFREKE